MKNKRRAALAEKVGKIAGDYKKVALQTPLRGRNSAECEEIRQFKSRMEGYFNSLSSAAYKIASLDAPLSRNEIRAEKFIGHIFADNYEVMIYDGDIGETLSAILG